jgi:hypothetical protein
MLVKLNRNKKLRHLMAQGLYKYEFGYLHHKMHYKNSKKTSHRLLHKFELLHSKQDRPSHRSQH